MLISPVPSGLIDTFPLLALVMAWPFTSSAPPSCGEVSSTTAVRPVLAAASAPHEVVE